MLLCGPKYRETREWLRPTLVAVVSMLLVMLMMDGHGDEERSKERYRGC
jgi:hypothetical protein